MSDDAVIAITTKRAFVTATAVPVNQEMMDRQCPTCRQAVAGLCVDCSLEPAGGGGGGGGGRELRGCLITRGTCGHYYHHHCMEKWLERQRTCPQCHAAWPDPPEFFTVD